VLTEAVETGYDFRALVRQHQATVFSIALHFLRDRATAEEVGQEVFFQPASESAPDRNASTRCRLVEKSSRAALDR